MGTSPKIVQFVCEHGAFRSRIAAAYFNAAATPGWRAHSAGREPQAAVSPALEPLLAGTPAFDQMERGAPTALRTDADRTIAIDCAVPADDHWVLAHRDADAGLRDELRDRVAALARALPPADRTGRDPRARA
jgi:hypothetical protein